MRNLNYLYSVSLFAVFLLIGFSGCTDHLLLSGGALLVPSGSSHVSLVPGADTSMVSFDFGYAPQNSKISHIFWLHNKGDEHLKIVDINPG
jgi:hypothetical protein